MGGARWAWDLDGDSGLALRGHSHPASVSHFASLDDFYPWQKATPIDMGKLLLDCERAQRVSPYCICARSGYVVLVELPSAASYIDPGALFFETQRRRAQNVYCVPFRRAIELAEELAPRVDFRQLLMLFNTGRCGSNLLSAALAEFQGVCSISEPDIFAPLYVPVPDGADLGPEEAAAPLVWAATVLLLHWAQQATPGFRLLVAKARSRLAANMCAALRALPRGLCAAMLYRRFLPTVGSMAVAFRPWCSRHWLLGTACALGLDPLLYVALWLMSSAGWRQLVGMPVVAGARPRVPARVVWRCGHLAVHAVKVITALEQARRAHAEGLLSFCVTYEALVQHRGAYLQRMLVACEAAAHAAAKHKVELASSGAELKREARALREGAELQEGATGTCPLRPGACVDAVFSRDQHQGRLTSCGGGPAMWRVVSQGGASHHGLSPGQVSRLEALRRWLQPGRPDADELLPGTLLPPE